MTRTTGIETPAEDAASPTSTLDDCSHAATTPNLRISDDPFYDPSPRPDSAFSCFNPNVTIDLSARYSAFLSHPRYGKEQDGMLASALEFPTSQTPSPLNASRLTNTTKVSTSYLPPPFFLLGVSTASEPIHISLRVLPPPRANMK